MNAAGFFGIDEHRVDARASWTGTQCPLDACHCFRLTFDQRLDPPVGQIAYPTGHALTTRHVACVIAETDALHATTNQKPPSHAHVGNTGLYRPAPRTGSATGGGPRATTYYAVSVWKPRSSGRPPGIPGHGIEISMMTSASA